MTLADRSRSYATQSSVPLSLLALALILARLNNRLLLYYNITITLHILLANAYTRDNKLVDIQ